MIQAIRLSERQFSYPSGTAKEWPTLVGGCALVAQADGDRTGTANDTSSLSPRRYNASLSIRLIARFCCKGQFEDLKRRWWENADILNVGVP